MNLRHLEHWLALAETGSFSRAAEKLHITQSALSRSIQSLEEELGGPLVDRIGKRNELTPLGHSVLERARRILSDLETAEAEITGGAGQENLYRAQVVPPENVDGIEVYAVAFDAAGDQRRIEGHHERGGIGPLDGRRRPVGQRQAAMQRLRPQADRDTRRGAPGAPGALCHRRLRRAFGNQLRQPGGAVEARAPRRDRALDVRVGRAARDASPAPRPRRPACRA